MSKSTKLVLPEYYVAVGDFNSKKLYPNSRHRDKLPEALVLLSSVRCSLTPQPGWLGHIGNPSAELLEYRDEVFDNLVGAIAELRRGIVAQVPHAIWPGSWGNDSAKPHRMAMFTRLESGIKAFENAGRPSETWKQVIAPMASIDYRWEFQWQMIDMIADFPIPNDPTLPRFLARFVKFCRLHDTPLERDCSVEIWYRRGVEARQPECLVYRLRDAAEHADPYTLHIASKEVTLCENPLNLIY